MECRAIKMDINILPVVNATLNGTAACLLLLGKWYIRRGDRRRHRRTMIAAFSVSTLFLASYLTYHAFHGVTVFQGPGWARVLYLSILGSHTVLAVMVVPLVLITLTRGLRDRIPKHRAIAKWTHPIWLYVSVTGVVVYLML